MTIDAIAEASIGLKEEYIPMVVSYIDFLKFCDSHDSTVLFPGKTKKTPKDALNIFSGSLVYMADDFNETPEEFREYL